MPLVLRIDSGSRKGEQVPLQPEVPLSFGCTDRSDVVLAADSFLSGVHFRLLVEGDTCTLQDLNSSNGTSLRGAHVTEASIYAGDSFSAGETLFTLLDAGAIKKAHSDAPKKLLPASRRRLLGEMRSGLQPLYAVLDGARDPRILSLLVQHKCQYVWLFQEGTPTELLSFAPYLVALPAESPIMEPLLDLGWEQDWGIYLTSSAGPANLLLSLRRLLLADQPDGQQVFLRFYDPRVLRPLLASSSPWQWPFFFSAVQSYLVPGEEPQTAVGFSQRGTEVDQSEILLSESSPVKRRPVYADRTQRASAPPAHAAHRLVLSAQQIDALKG
ncbi:MAG: DUF4123 domain-containing protein [Janthinobacterium lividum]